MELLKKLIKKHYIFIASFIYASAMMLISLAIFIAVSKILAFTFLFLIILEISYVLFKMIGLDDEI